MGQDKRQKAAPRKAAHCWSRQGLSCEYLGQDADKLDLNRPRGKEN